MFNNLYFIYGNDFQGNQDLGKGKGNIFMHCLALAFLQQKVENMD